MSMKKSPLSRVKEEFGTKDKLVEALIALPASVLERGDGEDKDVFEKRLRAAANTKLLRLHQMGQTISKRWGSKEGLVDALLTLQKRGKDKDYRTKLSAMPIGKLYDRVTSIERTSRRSARAS